MVQVEERCCGNVYFLIIQKCAHVMRMLAYGAPAYDQEDYRCMSESTATKSMYILEGCCCSVIYDGTNYPDFV